MNQSFDVQGMSCGHCERAVTQAVKSVDPQAQVKVASPAAAGRRCAVGTPLEAVADARAQVDEADEENNAFSGVC